MLFNAVISCVDVPEDYDCDMLCKQTVVFGIRNIEHFEDELVDSQESVESFFHNIAAGLSYEDRRCLILISAMWKVSITVVYPLGEIKIGEHEADLGKTDIVLVWNMCMHYSGSTHTNELHKLKPSRSKIYTNTSFHYPKVKVKTEVTDKTDKKDKPTDNTKDKPTDNTEEKDKPTDETEKPPETDDTDKPTETDNIDRQTHTADETVNSPDTNQTVTGKGDEAETPKNTTASDLFGPFLDISSASEPNSPAGKKEKEKRSKVKHAEPGVSSMQSADIETAAGIQGVNFNVEFQNLSEISPEALVSAALTTPIEKKKRKQGSLNNLSSSSKKMRSHEGGAHYDKNLTEKLMKYRALNVRRSLEELGIDEAMLDDDKDDQEVHFGVINFENKSNEENTQQEVIQIQPNPDFVSPECKHRAVAVLKDVEKSKNVAHEVIVVGSSSEDEVVGLDLNANFSLHKVKIEPKDDTKQDIEIILDEAAKKQKPKQVVSHHVSDKSK